MNTRRKLLLFGKRGGAPAFDPASLFASGEQGGVYKPKKINTLFEDASGTVPVTESLDPTGRLSDVSGNTNHLVQSTVSKKLTYVSGNPSHVSGDGVDDFLSTGQNIDLSVSEFWVWVVLKRPTGADSGTFLSFAGDNYQSLRIESDQIVIRAEASTENGVFIPYTFPENEHTRFLIRVRQSDRNVKLYINDTELEVTIPGSLWWNSLSGLYLFATNTDSAIAEGECSGAGYILRALTASEITSMNAYLNTLTT